MCTENCERANKRKHNREGNFSGSLFAIHAHKLRASRAVGLALAVHRLHQKKKQSAGTCCWRWIRNGNAYPNLNCIVSNSVIARLSLLSNLSALFLFFFGAHTHYIKFGAFIYHHHNDSARLQLGHASRGSSPSDSLLMTFLASNAIDDDHLCLLSGESARLDSQNLHCRLQKLISKAYLRWTSFLFDEIARAVAPLEFALSCAIA